MPWDEPGATAVVVATPEVEALTGSVYRLHARAGREGMFPHITLVVPFVPVERLDDDVEARLRSVLRGFDPFNYTLARLDRFADGVLYLAPEPPGPFVELVAALSVEFPDYQPYDGAHEAIVPHGTVAVSDNSELLDRFAVQVEPGLPIACRAEEATVVERGADLQWRPRAAFPLGG